LIPDITSGSAMMSPIRRLGLSEAIGSWKINCTRRRICRKRVALHRREVLAIEQNPPRDSPPQLQHRATQRGLAATGLADQTRVSPRATCRFTSDTAWIVLRPQHIQRRGFPP